MKKNSYQIKLSYCLNPGANIMDLKFYTGIMGECDNYNGAKQLKIGIREDFFKEKFGIDYKNESKRKNYIFWIKKLK
jgi:hypothetical protein